MNGKILYTYRSALFEIIALRSSRGRATFFVISSLLIYMAPISILAGLSIWHKLGIPSPSIGLTRAYHYVLHGELVQAWRQNWLIYVILLVGLPIIIKDAYNTLMLIQHKRKHN